jgi:hypothetical protein
MHMRVYVGGLCSLLLCVVLRVLFPKCSEIMLEVFCVVLSTRINPPGHVSVDKYKSFRHDMFKGYGYEYSNRVCSETPPQSF